MTYTKQTWADSPATSSPISAARLGHIEAGIISNDQGAFASRPAGQNAGDQYHCTDIGNEYMFNGTAWVPTRGGDLTVFTPPPTTFTAFNSGSVSAALDSRVITMSSSTGDFRGEFWNTGISTNYTKTFYFDFHVTPTLNYVACAIVLKAAASAPIIHFGYQTDTGLGAGFNLAVSLWTNYTTFSAHYQRALAYTLPFFLPHWLRVRDDATTRYYEYSYNGTDWGAPFYSHGRTTGVTPDQIGWGLSCNNSGGAYTATGRLRSFA